MLEWNCGNRGDLMKKKILLPLILVATLIFSIAAPHLSHLKTAFAAVDEGKVVVTGLSVDKDHVTAGEKVEINVTFEGGKNVQPNTTLEIDLPQKSTNLAGLYGVNTSFTINGVYNEGQEGQKEVPNIATVQIKNDKAIVTFNESVKELPNGFTGHFTFKAEAQLATNVTEGSQQTTITVNGQQVTITIDKDQTTSGSGTNPTAPIDDSKEYVGKYGEAGKSGNVNWVVSGATSGNHTGDVVITDIPSGVASTIETDTFVMTIRQNIYSSGQATSSQTMDYSFASLQKLGYITLKDDGGFVIKMPAWMLNNSQWEIRYRSIPTEEIQEGQIFDNKVSVTTNEKTYDTSYQVVINQGGSGAVNGSGSSSTVVSSDSTDVTTSTVEISSESTDVTTSSTEETTVPEESTTSAVESSTDSTESTTSSTEETTVPEESTTGTTESSTDSTDVTTSSTEETTVPEESTTSTSEDIVLPVESTTDNTDNSTVETTDTTSAVDSTVSTDESTTVPTDTESTTASDDVTSSDVNSSDAVSSDVSSSDAIGTTDTTTSVRQDGSGTTIVNRSQSTSTTTTRTSSNSNEEGMLPQTGTKRAIGLVIVGVILVIGIITYVVIRRRS